MTRTFRSGPQRAFALAGVVMAALLVLVSGPSLFAGGGDRTGGAVGTLLGVVVGFVSYRLARARVAIDAGGVVVVNPFAGPRVVPWSDIAGFEMRFGGLRGWTGYLLRHHGEGLWLTAIHPAHTAPSRRSPPAPQRIVDELNDVLAGTR